MVHRVRPTDHGPLGALRRMRSLTSADPETARADLAAEDQLPRFEVQLKQAGADPAGWAFYNFRAETAATAPKVAGDTAGYSYHADDGAVDHAFVQFYPLLRPWLLPPAESALD